MNTYVTVSKEHKDLITKSIINSGHIVNFYTIETNEKLLCAEINCSDPCIMWHIAKAVGQDEAFAIMDKQLKKII